MNEAEYFTTAQIASKLQVSGRTILRLLADGELKGIKLDRVWRIQKEEFEKFLRSKEKSNK